MVDTSKDSNNAPENQPKAEEKKEKVEAKAENTPQATPVKKEEKKPEAKKETSKEKPADSKDEKAKHTRSPRREKKGFAKKDDEKKFDEKVLYINRCTKVVKGGRRFSFSALILVGDRKGKIGFGFAKANEVADAIRKATQAAKKDLITFAMEGTTIPHSVIVKQDGVNLLLKPAQEGAGIIAGSMVRSVFELAGVKDVVGKSWGSNNPNNQVRAIFKALKSLKKREDVMAMREE